MDGDEIDCEVEEWISQEEGVIQLLDFINMAIDVREFCQYGKECASFFCQYGN
jgi:hypothetical protein